MPHLPAFPRRLAILISLGCIAFAASIDAAAATIALTESAVTAAVMKRLFVDEGRRVLAGSLGSCNYAYVERPAVAFRGGRLHLRLHFAGRAGINSSGGCMGASDAFNAAVSGQPVIQGETITLSDVRMEEGKPEYRTLLEPLLRRQLPALLGSNLRSELSRYLDATVGDFRMAVQDFKLLDVSAQNGALVVRFDFALQALPR